MLAPLADSSRFGLAWVLLCAALAIHVADEAVTGFLAVYNSAVRAIRERVPFLPLPTFTFRIWLGGLVVAAVGLASLAPFAFARAAWMTVPASAFAIIMLGNGVLHIGASIYRRRFMPGVYSAPLLIAAAAWLLLSIR
jgi:Protein of unknown function with HXXEE motif